MLRITLAVTLALAAAGAINPPAANAQGCQTCVPIGGSWECKMSGSGYLNCTLNGTQCLLDGTCNPQRHNLAPDGTAWSRSVAVKRPELALAVVKDGTTFTRGCRGSVIRRSYSAEVALSKRSATDVLSL